MVDLIIDNNYSKINGELSEYTIDRIYDTLAFMKQNYAHSVKFIDGKWDGSIRLFKKRDQSFLSGLVVPVVKILQDCNVEFKIIDKRLRTENNFPELQYTKPETHEFRDYQEFTINRAIQKTRGILNVGTGGGKTSIVAELIGRLKVKPFMFYVTTRDLLYQAKDTLSGCLNVPIGQIGDSVVDIRDINVCTKDAVLYCLNKHNKNFDKNDYKFDVSDIWSEDDIFGETDAEKIVNLVKESRGLYMDECHHASSKTCRDIVLASENCFWRYGGTATYEREDGEEMFIQGLFGRKIVQISLSYLIRHKWLVDAGVIFCPVDSKGVYSSYPKIYSQNVVHNTDVAKSIADNCRYFASLGKSSLVLVSQIEHGNKIKKLLPEAEFLTGRDPSKKRKRIIKELVDGTKQILIATTLADEGLDIKRLQFVHIAGAGASITRIPQRIGRVVRKHACKSCGVAIYYHYCAKHLYDHGQKTKKLVSEENALEIIQCKGLDDLRSSVIKYLTKKESIY